MLTHICKFVLGVPTQINTHNVSIVDHPDLQVRSRKLNVQITSTVAGALAVY